MSIELAVRNGTPADWDFVLATWLRSHKHSGYGAKRIESRAYFEHHHPLCKRLLLRSCLDVAVAPGADNVILGYAVHDAHALHWVYVKKSFRRFGIATRLLKNLTPGVRLYTHQNDTDGSHALVSKRLASMSYNPYAVEESS